VTEATRKGVHEGKERALIRVQDYAHSFPPLPATVRAFLFAGPNPHPRLPLLQAGFVPRTLVPPEPIAAMRMARRSQLAGTGAGRVDVL
jgi:hypothetical protein